ncbi:hypothetical protein D9O29_16980 [Pantoea vagans]|uniref:Uncharacterized protein n=1 Tax=Pantoea vagans TaxID=470934 RepID=A0AAN1TUA6_9GAMM|nr:hypothetical protein C9381_02565 [Pantoea vagans]TXL76966.1 hypothetical protein D9O29_16980 [Pantoea vagans]
MKWVCLITQSSALTAKQVCPISPSPGRRRRRQSGSGQRADPGSILKYVTRGEHCPESEWQVSQADM